MTLTGRVTQVESAKEYVDKVERITIQVDQSKGAFASRLTVPNTEGFKLDDELMIDVNITVKEHE
jgi:hypothetical protein